jgi:DNA-binding phage protein
MLGHGTNTVGHEGEVMQTQRHRDNQLVDISVTERAATQVTVAQRISQCDHKPWEPAIIKKDGAPAMSRDRDDQECNDREIDERYLVSFSEEHFNERLRRSPHIGAFLEQLIQEQGLTVAEVARAAGLHKSSIYRILQGLRYPKRDTLLVLLEEFGLSVHQISRALMFAGYAPLHHLRQAAQPWPSP